MVKGCNTGICVEVAWPRLALQTSVLPALVPTVSRYEEAPGLGGQLNVPYGST